MNISRDSHITESKMNSNHNLPSIKETDRRNNSGFKLDPNIQISSRSRALMKNFLTKSFDVT